MMKWPLLSLALVLTACDTTAPPQPEAPESAFATQTRALDRARAVEGELMDAAAAQREQIDAAASP
jgi:hypothetical protein